MLNRRELVQYSAVLLACSSLPAMGKSDDLDNIVTTVRRFKASLSNQTLLEIVSIRRQKKGHLSIKILGNDRQILIIEEQRIVQKSTLASFKKLEL